MSPRRLPTCLVAVAFMGVTGCGEQVAYPDSIHLANFQTLSSGQDEGGEFCRDFNLTSEQAEWFFSRAKLMDARQLYERFDHLPCWVRGAARSNRGTWQWEIRAGGTARVVSPEGKAELLGCDECDAVLTGAGNSAQ